MSTPVLSEPLAPPPPPSSSFQQTQQQLSPPPQPSNVVVDPNFRKLSFDDSFGQVFFIFRQRYRAFLTITFINYMVGWMVALIAAYLLGADLQIDGFSVSVSVSMSSTTHYSFANVSDYSFNDDNGALNNNNNYNNDNYGNDDPWSGGAGYYNHGWYYDENGNVVQSSPGMEAWQIMFYYIESAIYYCFLCVAHGASVWLAAHLYLDQHPSLEDAYRQAGKQVGSLVTSLIVTGLVVGGPMLVFAIYMAIAVAYQSDAAVLWGVFFALFLVVWMTFIQVVFYHTYPVIMVEKLGPVAALERSYHLTSGQRGFLFGVLLCWGIIRLFTGFVIAAISITGLYPYTWQWWLAKLLDTLCAILFAALESVLQAVLYLRSRVVNEQLDRVTLAGELGSDSFSSGGADQHYIVMGNLGNEDNERIGHDDGQDGNDRALKAAGVMA